MSPGLAASKDVNTSRGKMVMNTNQNELSANEIKQRVQEIRKRWKGHERLARRLIGEARREALEAMLAPVSAPVAKVA